VKKKLNDPNHLSQKGELERRSQKEELEALRKKVIDLTIQYPQKAAFIINRWLQSKAKPKK
jgi:hypothetical protein